jgi:PhnB protein
MTQINAYVNFNGRCREAMNFYKDCFGGTLNFQNIAGSPVEDFCGPQLKDGVLHSTLEKDGLLLMGSDMKGPFEYVQGNNITLSINCSSEEEINTLFSKFSSEGEVLEPLKTQFWGALFAVVTDKFGIRWMFNYDARTTENVSTELSTAAAN